MVMMMVGQGLMYVTHNSHHLSTEILQSEDRDTHTFNTFFSRIKLKAML